MDIKSELKELLKKYLLTAYYSECVTFAIGTWPRSLCFPVGSQALEKMMNEQIDARSLEKNKLGQE